MPHIDSYYAATAHPAPAHPQLQGAMECDVCVVGAGIAGCATALELAERGYRVALLEGERVGWGASGRSGGQAIFGYGTSQASLAAQVGPEAARRMWDVSIGALDWVGERVARHGIDCDLRWGHLHAATKPRQRDELLELQREHGAEGFQVIGIAADFRDKVLAYADEMSIDYPLMIGEQEALDAAAAFGVEAIGFPFTVFSDRRGRIVTAHLGELTEPEAALILEAVRHVDAGKRSPQQARVELGKALAALPAPPEEQD